ncbi:hypothetical protein KP803_12030 [Vibrio sp. ZSDE26]|uniref:Uncharacterized protein n=1 Tax=Vibrio amylolyticus TaxID=2847292 RepID=A0A9X1XJD3_9VIBR|nr:hypothetical protein [Vibrio amylolyticus]MCK6263999.1 hypothetical protein [Vibrio amylolyticus]
MIEKDNEAMVMMVQIGTKFFASCVLAIFFIALSYASQTQASSTYHSYIFQPFLSDVPLLNLTQLKRDPNLYDCGLERDNEEFCGEGSRYYNTDVDARLMVDQSDRATALEITSDFSLSAYTEMQLSLRKDGFQVRDVYKNDQRFSVSEKLAIYGEREVDKALVEFINQGSSSDPIEISLKLMTVSSNSELDRTVNFVSDGVTISILFSIHKE